MRKVLCEDRLAQVCSHAQTGALLTWLLFAFTFHP